MPPTFLDILPIQTQPYLVPIAACISLVGLILWLAGIKFARASASLLAGIVVAILCTWLLPHLTGMDPATFAIVGFSFGLVTGAVFFRALQGIVIALCCALAVACVYDRWHVPPQPAPAVAAAHPATQPVHHAILIVPSSSPLNIAGTLHDRVLEHWNAIPTIHQQRIEIFSAAAAIIALAVALTFPRHTTCAATALLGSLLLATGGYALLQRYAPQYLSFFPATHLTRYGSLAIATLLGILIQRIFFWPRKKTQERGSLASSPIPDLSPMPPGH